MKTFDQFLLPLMQSFVTATFATITATGLAIWQNWPKVEVIALITFGFIGTFSWWGFRARQTRAHEYLHHVHLDEPLTQPAKVDELTIRIHAAYDDGGDFLSVPGGRSRLEELAERIIRGGAFTFRSCAGLYSPIEFSQLRDELLAQGYLRQRGRDPKQGVEVSKKGMAFLSGLAHARGNISPTDNGHPRINQNRAN